jgi:phage terminase small subunit
MPPLSNSRHEQFAQLVARGASATRAYGEAGYRTKSDQVAAVNGSRLLGRAKVKARVAELRASQTAELMERHEVSREEVIRRYWAIVQAEPSDLVEVRVAACRHCHGVEHAYQWRSEAEFEKAHADWITKRDVRKKNRTPFGEPEPSAEGGFGYSRELAPNPECENCDGDGEAWVRTKASEGHPLFAGAKETRDGQIEVKLADRMAALEAVGRITGVFERDNRQKADVGSGLLEALRERMRQVSSLPVLNAGEVLGQAQEKAHVD